MNQTRIESIIERACDVITAFIISYMLYEYLIRPNIDYISSFNVVLLFTIVSMIRGYFWRRFFNKGLHKTVHKILINTGKNNGNTMRKRKDNFK